MHRSAQVSLYFLYNLDKLRIFVDLAERHWNEELKQYNESNLETDEATCWDRYKYCNDLSAHFQEIFPQYQRQSFLLMLVSLFEDYLNQLCLSLHIERKLSCNLKDYDGYDSGIERAKNYLKKIAKVNVPTETKSWQQIINAQKIRNTIAHNAGHLDEKLHIKQLQIVAKSSNLNSQQFARIHLEINQAYLFEVIEAMSNIANELGLNTKENA